VLTFEAASALNIFAQENLKQLMNIKDFGIVS